MEVYRVTRTGTYRRELYFKGRLAKFDAEDIPPSDMFEPAPECAEQLKIQEKFEEAACFYDFDVRAPEPL